MPKKFLITLSFFTVSILSYGLPKANAFLQLIGQSASTPVLANLINQIEYGQHNASFDRNSNTYELNAYSEGMTFLFNQNFILKEIHFYDSGHLYQAFKGDLPLNLRLNLHHTYFQENYSNFAVDTFNQFLYHSSFANGSATVYFKNKHIELVKIVGDPNYIAAQDRSEMRNWGLRIIPDGKCVKGNCYTDFGIMKWSTSLKYEGAWDFGIPNGEGMMEDSLGLKYSGGYRLGFLWGEGMLSQLGQYIYKGSFFMGKKYGLGEIRYNNGTRYSGYWQNDQMHGQGHFYFSESYHYDGTFKNNQFNGYGTLYTPEGYLEGEFKDGKPHGKGKQVATSNQSTLSGKWVNGKKEGVFEAYNPLMGTYSIVFENDIEIKKTR